MSKHDCTLAEKLMIELAAVAIAVVIAHYGYAYLKNRKQQLAISA